jgi:hypothetical protein
MNTTELVLVVEEAHLYTTRQKMSRYDLGEPKIVRVLRTGRKHGVSVAVVDQTPSELPAAVLGNLATRIVFRLTNHPCVRAISYTMGLKDDQEAELAELERRRAIVQTGGIPKPFVISVVEIPERYRPAESELLERERASLEVLDYEFCDVDVAEILLGKKKDEEAHEFKTIRGDMHKVLVRICEVPCEVIDDRCRATGIDRTGEFRARKNLLKLGMIEQGDRVGSKWQLYVATEKGRQWARSLGLKVPAFKSGVGHEFMVKKIRQRLTEFFIDIEFFPPGESLGVCGIQPDLLAGLRRKDGDSSWRVAIQVSSTNKAEYEVERAVGLSGIAQIDLVIIVAKNKTAAGAIERKLREAEGRAQGSGGGLVNRDGSGERVIGGDAQETGGGDNLDRQGDSEIHIQKGAGWVEVLDFETCVSASYDWSWVAG